MSEMAWRTEFNPGNANRACGNFIQSLLVNQASRDQHYHAVSVASLMGKRSKSREGRNVRDERCWPLEGLAKQPAAEKLGDLLFFPCHV